METIEEIDKEISELEEEYNNTLGTKTEVYSRIVGYYRTISNWNPGKRQEFEERKEFSILTKKDNKIEI